VKVRAVAAPSQDSTAVGSVELQCTAHGLSMRYLSVGAYQKGYAPGALTQGTQVVAPWPDVTEVRTHQDAVLVSVSPLLTPHHKLYLKNFSQGDVDEGHRLQKKRMLRGAALLLMFAVVLSLSIAGPFGPPRAGQVSALGLGLLAAFGVLVSALLAERIWLAPAESSETLQRRFLAEVQYYRPLPVLPARSGPVSEFQFVDWLKLLPRSTAAIVIVLSAGSLSAVLTSSWILGTTGTTQVTVQSAEPRAVAEAPVEPKAAEEPPRVPAAAPEPSPVVAQPEAPAAAAPLGGACRCERPHSVLWHLPLPRLSTLMIEQRARSHEDHHHVELELAVVNNGKTPLKEISIGVDFFDGPNKELTKHRPLYYESWLNPGEAIKWHVEARGTSFVITNPLEQVLAPEDLASADAFEPLLRANHRPVRLHAAMMLAYLGDPRARTGAVELSQALREEEGPFLERVLAAIELVVPCEVRSRNTLAGSTVEMCVFNRASEPKRELSIRLRGLDSEFDFRKPVAPPPAVLGEKTFELPGELAGGEGRWVSLELPNESTSGMPKFFEAFVTSPPN
jgi:hypothetical protein